MVLRSLQLPFVQSDSEFVSVSKDGGYLPASLLKTRPHLCLYRSLENTSSMVTIEGTAVDKAEHTKKRRFGSARL
jgi:hypothetical protein